jgi:2-amino-4-hydroxy-6-hydroxymethyldihydropteridine diphosphokinase
MRTAYIALGSNLASWAGPPEVTMASALSRLRTLASVEKCSSLYSTTPVGFAEQPRFLNAVIEIITELEPQTLLRALLAIEKEYGRDRAAGIINGPRTLDLDILLLGNLQISDPGLELPHPRLADRAFVLIPLNEIASELKIAGHGKSVSVLLEELQGSCQGESDAVLRVESDLWSDAAGRSAAGPSPARRTASRGTAGEPDDHSRR